MSTGPMVTSGSQFPFPETEDPVLRAVSRWLDEVEELIPEAVQRRGTLAAIAWLVGPALDTPSRVPPRF